MVQVPTTTVRVFSVQQMYAQTVGSMLMSMMIFLSDVLFAVTRLARLRQFEGAIVVLLRSRFVLSFD